MTATERNFRAQVRRILDGDQVGNALEQLWSLGVEQAAPA